MRRKDKGKKMKNGLIIGGVKIMFTPEQIEDIRAAFSSNKEVNKNRLEDVAEGELFKLGKYEMVVLEHGVQGGTAVLLKELYEDKVKFGENNNFNGSNAARKCLGFADELAEIIGAENIITHTVDLMSDDGLKDYGTVDCRASLLTADMYRKYVYILDKYKLDCWWWLATAYSTPTHDDAEWIKCVSPAGCIFSHDYFYDSLGVRPFCILKSDIFVS